MAKIEQTEIRLVLSILEAKAVAQALHTMKTEDYRDTETADAGAGVHDALWDISAIHT